MTQPRHFGAVMSAMVTPFDAQGRVDLDAAQRLARWLAAHGNDGLVVAATTGEASTLTDDERCDLIQAVAQAVTIPVLAGTGSNDTAHSVMLTKRARALGAAGVLVVANVSASPSGSEIRIGAIKPASLPSFLLVETDGTGKIWVSAPAGDGEVSSRSPASARMIRIDEK